MGTIADKLSYLNETKTQFREKLNKLGADILDNATFRNYLIYLNNLYNGLFNLTDMSENGIVGRTNQDDTPSPSTPQEIKDLNGDITYSINGKNILKFDNANNPSRSLYTYTTEREDLIVCTKNATGNDFYAQFIAYLESGKTYILSVDDDTNRNIYMYSDRLWGTAINDLANKNAKKGTPFTFTSSYTGKAVIGFFGGSSQTLTKPMLEIGTEATSFEPYIPKRDFTLSLNADGHDIHLDKIGIYQDKIYAKDNKFYLHKQIGKFTYNNEGSVNTPATNYYNISGLGNQGWLLSLNTKFYLSNKYEAVKELSTDGNFQTETANMDYAFGIHTNGTTIRFKDSRGLSGEDLKTDLIGTEIYFALATSSTTEITSTSHPTLYNQLKEIQDYLIKYKSKYELILNYDKPNIKY